MTFRTALLLACLIFTLPCVSAHHEPAPRTSRPLAAVKRSITAAPVLDGGLTDPLWKEIPPATEFTDLQTGKLAVDPTVARITYDDDAIYVAFECSDSQPEGVIGRELERDTLYQRRGNDSGGGTEDWVEVSFDTFLSFKENDQAKFAVNPLGTRSARFGGGRANKAEWSGAWEAAVKRTPTGWSAELRIPWKVLNYPTARSIQKRDFGLNFTRFQYRTRIRSQWSNTGLQNFSNLIGRWKGVDVPRGAFNPTLSLLPYTLTFAGDGPIVERMGVDARYQATPDLTAVVSVNPDFATVENAVQSIGFSRSERFVEERRPFFLEGGDYFRTGQFFGLGPLFYSNRIEQFDVGAKVFGKLTPQDTIGILLTEDFGNRSDLVARYRHDLSPTAQAGFFVNQKDAKAGDHNSVGGLFANNRWGKVGFDTEQYVSGGRVDKTKATGYASANNIQYSDGNHFTSLRYLTASPTFQDANGLVFFNDFKGFSGYHNWNREWRKGAWRSFEAYAVPQYWWHQDGRPYQRGAFVGVNFQTRSDWSLGINVNHSRFDDDTDRTVGLDITSGVSNRFKSYGMSFKAGTQGGAPTRFLGPKLSVRALKRLDVIYQGGIQEQKGWNRQHIATFNYQFSGTRTVGGRVVSLTEPGKPAATNWYVSYRNAGGAGTELYFLVGDPNAVKFTPRAAVKLVFAR
nr:carbohydrate binding family 9 domain-containing protein [Armatimonas sp.]